MASRSGWNLWVWLVGLVVRSYIDFLSLYTHLVSVLFGSSIPTLYSFFLNVFRSCISSVHLVALASCTCNIQVYLSCLHGGSFHSPLFDDQEHMHLPPLKTLLDMYIPASLTDQKGRVLASLPRQMKLQWQTQLCTVHSSLSLTEPAHP